MDLEIADLKKWFEGSNKEVLNDLFTFLRFKSVSTDPAFQPEVLKTAAFLKEYLERVGFSAELWDTPNKQGGPVLFASRKASTPGAKTVVIYHHYDVQPPDPIELWDSGPFEPVIKDGQVYARGAQDNKGQCFYTLTLLKAIYQMGVAIDINIKLFIEGEEECGSRGSSALLTSGKYDDRLKADYLLVVDGGLNADGVPGINVGARGIACVNVMCKNAARDLHSGMTGGIVLNPAKALVRALAACWDANGAIAIPGFYEDVAVMSKKEKEGLDFIFDETEFKRSTGARVLDPEPGYSAAESASIRPTLEINGITSGYGGQGTKTIIPSVAACKLSMRLVLKQDPDKMAQLLVDFLQSKLPEGLEVSFDLHHGGAPFCTPADSEVARVACEAFSEVLGGQCQKFLCGGSIPITPLLEKACGGEALVIGYGLEDDWIHAPNEHFALSRFEQGYLTMGRILSKLSR